MEVNQDQHRPESDKAIVHDDKQTGRVGEVQFLDSNIKGYATESNDRLSPPKQVLPPNNTDLKPSPIVPQLQPHLSAKEANCSREVTDDVEAQKQLHESIEKVTSEYQALQKSRRH